MPGRGKHRRDTRSKRKKAPAEEDDSSDFPDTLTDLKTSKKARSSTTQNEEDQSPDGIEKALEVSISEGHVSSGTDSQASILFRTYRIHRSQLTAHRWHRAVCLHHTTCRWSLGAILRVVEPAPWYQSRARSSDARASTGCGKGSAATS